MRWLLDAVYLVALVVLLPWLVWRAWRTKRYRRGLKEKLWGLQRDLPPPAAVWFHGVSLGEIHVLRQLVGAFRQAHPGRSIVVSSTTETGLDEAKKCFSDVEVIRFPFDFSWAVRRTLRRLRPPLVVLCESELWPNFLLAARDMKVPVAVVNGRMSPRSTRRFAMVAALVRWMFRIPDLWAMQTAEYAAGVLALGGVPGQVQVTGSIKYDGAQVDRDRSQTRELRALLGIGERELVWVAGSTLAPEEQVILDIYARAREAHPQLRLILVPRQPDRFDEVARLLQRSGLPFVRRSALPGEAAPVVLVDTTGELSAVWGLAHVAYVGGSLDGKRGGQNMIEPAALGVPVTFGPHVWNFKETAARLVGCGGAYQVADKVELEQVIRRLLGDAEERRQIGAAGRAFVLSQQGATRRTLALLDGVLGKAERAAA